VDFGGCGQRYGGKEKQSYKRTNLHARKGIAWAEEEEVIRVTGMQGGCGL
jgi:hypothetical protein